MGEQAKTLSERDAEVIWHPYTQHKTAGSPLGIIKGEGVYLVDENGNKYIDAISSWWTNLHGHAHPYIAQRIFEQAGRLEHVIFAGCTHEPAIELAERLLPLLPGNFSKIFYSDNGSTAVEVALKMAVQFSRNKDKGIKTKIIALKQGYHGDTFGAMSVSDRGVFTLAFEDYLFEVIFIDPPNGQNLDEIKTTIGKLQTEASCFIYEPLVQGAGGMKMYDAESLNELLCFLKQSGVICIADEVMTGFGRTGNLFASEYLHHKPDIICLSKGLTGGALPLAVTACTQNIFDAFLSDDLKKTFFHGHSYTANPIACAAALASLDLLRKEECLENIGYITETNSQFIHKLSGNSKLMNPRSLGTILALELVSGESKYLNKIKDEVIRLSLAEAVFLRPLGNTIYIMPPYCITPIQLQKLHSVIDKIIDKV